jgi:predicted regulator of Ras-like GTPase activity (Roadblock/LC7/MglB family)
MDKAKAITVTKERIDRLDRLLGEFCTQTNTVWAIFTTISGQLLVQRGFVRSFDVLGISALACGVFNSTMELARIVGEQKFSQFLQEGSRYSVYYISVDEDYLLVSLFDDRTLAGIVKVASEVFSSEAVKVLGNKS